MRFVNCKDKIRQDSRQCSPIVIERGYVEGKIAGRIRDALDRGGLAARIVKHGQDLRAVLV